MGAGLRRLGHHMTMSMRHEVDRPGDDLDPHGVGLNAEHAGDEGLEGGAGAHEPGQVEGLGLPEVDPSGFIGGMDRRHHQARRDDDQHDAGDAEEPREVDAQAALVDEIAENHREDDPQAARPPS